MSRVERHKDEYSKDDRKALEQERRAGAKQEADSSVRSVSTGAASAGRTGRAARNAAAESAGKTAAKDPDMGIWDQTEEEKRRARKEAREMGDGRPEFHGGRAFGRFLSGAGTLILIFAIVACLGLAVPRFAGIGQYVVVSGSMEPAIHVGSMVYSAQTEPSTLEAGDVIVFYSDETGDTPVTHRVVENHVADGEVITKGDANAQNDLSPVIYSNILGKVQLTVPMLGYVAAPMGSMMGKIAMGCVILAAYILTLVGSKLSRK